MPALMIRPPVAGGCRRRRRSEDRTNVVFGNRRDQYARSAIVFDQKVADEVDRVAPARCGKRSDRFSGMLR
jgi:hypothetical protein